MKLFSSSVSADFFNSTIIPSQVKRRVPLSLPVQVLLIFCLTALLYPQGLRAGVVIDVGNGLEGDWMVQSNQNITWGPQTTAVSTLLSASVTTNQTQISVVETTGFNVNDEILLYVVRAKDSTQGAGQYETFHVVNVSGSNSLTLDHGPASVYDPAQEMVLVQRVPNFNNVTIDGTLTAAPWNETNGGIIFFRVRDTFTISGTLSAAGAGFQGSGSGANGESWSLDGLGSAGQAYGGAGLLDADLTFRHLLLGSGGAGGSGPNFGTGTAGVGGRGAGLIYVSAYKIVMTGSIVNTGNSGTAGGFGAQSGGCGSGGIVWLQCWDALRITSAAINRSGGFGLMADHGGFGATGGPGISRLDFQYGPEPYVTDSGLILYAGSDTNVQVDAVSLFPSILTQPQSVPGLAGSTVTFQVGATGSLPLGYQWLFDGISLMDNAHISGSHSNLLIVSGITAVDAGRFQAIMTNAYGSISSSNATVLGAFPPSIFIQPASKAAIAGTSLSLEVTANGSAPLKYQWQKSSSGPLAGQTNGSLILSPVSTNDNDVYFVVISNAYGAVTSLSAMATIYSPDTNQSRIVNAGNGSDGDFAVPTNQTMTWGSQTYAASTSLEMSTQTNQTRIEVRDTAGFEIGDEVLFYVYQAYDATGSAGRYETFHLIDVQGHNFLTLDHAPSPIFDISREIVLVQRVPNFNTVSIDGTLSAAPWNGNAGGVIFFRTRSSLAVNGTITLAGAGFPGGGSSGVSWSLDGAAGAGVGNGVGGSFDGDQSFQHLFLGSGGSGGSGASFGSGGTGGSGGGLLYVSADTISISGTINVSGGNEFGGSFGSTGGGGGSGGEAWLQCRQVSGTNCINILRNGGLSGAPDHGLYGNPGNPGLSRLDFHSAETACANVDQTNGVDSIISSPTIIAQPQDAKGFVGSSATFRVLAAGSAPLFYQWQFNGSNLVEGLELSGTQSNILTIANLQLAKAGNYQVIVSNQTVTANATASVTSNPASLTVLAALEPAGASITSLGFCPALTISGTVGTSIYVQRTSNVADTNSWITLTNLTLTQPIELWVDTSVDASSPFNAKNFYRIVPTQ